MSKFKFKKFIAATIIMTSVSAANLFAHGAWIAQRWDKNAIVIGEGWKDNKYNPKQIYNFKALDKNYDDSSAKLVKCKDHAEVEYDENVSVIAFYADYGYWSNTTEGKWVNKTMDKVPGSTIGTHAIKISVNYVGSVEKPEPVDGLSFQIVPLCDVSKLEVGSTYQVQVLHDGKPMSDVDIIPNVTVHHDRTVKTDKNGIATVTVENAGVNCVGLEMVFNFDKPDGKATREKIFTSMSFTTTFYEFD